MHPQEKNDPTPKRVNRGYMLSEDLILACKRLALEQERRLYEVMEDALREYLERHQNTKKWDKVPVPLVVRFLREYLEQHQDTTES